MAVARSLPEELRGTVFDHREAASRGITRAVLRSRRIVHVFPGVFRYADTDLTHELHVAAAWRHLARSAVVSHTTSLRLRGLDLGDPLPLHFATSSHRRSHDPSILLHRYRREPEQEVVGNAPMTTPARTFVDCATLLSMSELLACGDWMVARRLLTPAELQWYVLDSHLDGVRRARAAAEWVRAGVESVRESMTRWHLITHGLPEPQINSDIRDELRAFVARGDLVYREFKIVVEYDGWYHERDLAQRHKDVLRREALEAAGWLVVVITAADSPGAIARRVHAALVARGYLGPAPYLDPMKFGWLGKH